MWGQGVENLARDCTLKAIANRRLVVSDKTIENVKKRWGLSSIADTLKPCIESKLYDALKAFALDRNEVAHSAGAAYMSSIITQRPAAEVELWKLHELKRSAGDLYGPLLDLHTELST